MVTCIKCRQTVESDWTYCPRCGASLKVKSKSTKSRGNGTGTAYKRGKTWTARLVVGYRVQQQKDGTFKKFEPYEESVTREIVKEHSLWFFRWTSTEKVTSTVTKVKVTDLGDTINPSEH